MSPPLTYVVVDIESDGPLPGRHSLLNLAAVATDEAGAPVATFCENLETLPCATTDPGTEAWCRSIPDALARVQNEPSPPPEVMHRFGTFVQAQPGDRILAGHPLMLDGRWIDHYLRRFLGAPLIEGRWRGARLFHGAGMDLPSFVAGVTGHDLRLCRHGSYPEAVTAATPHTHHGLDDAMGHAEILRRALALRGTPRGRAPAPRRAGRSPRPWCSAGRTAGAPHASGRPPSP